MGAAAPSDAGPVADRHDGEHDAIAFPAEEVEQRVLPINHAPRVAPADQDHLARPVVEAADHKPVVAGGFAVQLDLVLAAERRKPSVRLDLTQEEPLADRSRHVGFRVDRQRSLEAPLDLDLQRLGRVSLGLGRLRADDDRRGVGAQQRRGDARVMVLLGTRNDRAGRSPFARDGEIRQSNQQARPGQSLDVHAWVSQLPSLRAESAFLLCTLSPSVS